MFLCRVSPSDVQNSFWTNTGVGDQYFMCQILVHNNALDLLLFKSGKSRVLHYSHYAIRVSLALECYVTSVYTMAFSTTGLLNTHVIFVFGHGKHLM